MKRKNIIVVNLFLVFVFILTAGFGCKSPSRNVEEKLAPIELNFWRVFDDSDAFDEIITAYRQIHPNITINYRKFRFEEYEQALLEALAEDQGPDIFSINEGWVKKYESKLAPMPNEITLAYQYTKGTIKKEIAYELKTENSPTLREIKSNFADTIYNDIILDGQVYGLPLSLETLVMFYNKDILNKSGVAQTPKTWKTFQEAVQQTTRFDTEGNIIQSGTTLGTAHNIDRNFDIISILMMQNGAQMTDSSGQTTFSINTQDKYNPGIEALRFYLDFSSPVKSVYSWNSEMPHSFDAFLSGKVAFTFGYNYHIPSIKSRAPKLNFGIAPIPQINPDNPINYANYWIEGVSKKSQHQDEAWDFIIFATKAANVTGYLASTQRPTALKSLLNTQTDDEDLYSTSIQMLTATNWYQGSNQAAAEDAFQDMLDDLPKAESEKVFSEILKNTTIKINQTVK